MENLRKGTHFSNAKNIWENFDGKPALICRNEVSLQFKKATT
jgi:hypothetical protein